MDLSSFLASLKAVRELGTLVQVASSDVRKLQAIGVGVDVVSTATSGAVVLCVARFEDYLKGIAEHFLSAYTRATPPIKRSALSTDLQFVIMAQNISAATQRNRHGVSRSPAELQRHIQHVAGRIVSDDIWGDDAISTHSNPGPDTVTEILKLLGVDKPWVTLKPVFEPLWAAHRSIEPSHKEIPSPNEELRSIIGWRNICAHSSGTPTIGAREIWEMIAYFEALSTAIDSVLAQTSKNRITALGSVPAPWS